VGLHPKELLCDGAYGSAEVRAELGKLGVEVVAKLRPLTDSKHFRKDEFEIDLEANEGEGSVRCPAGVRTTDFRMARNGWYRPVKLLRFPREVCEECELKELCLGGPNGRVKHIPCVTLPAGAVALPQRGVAERASRTENRRAEKGAQGELETPSEGGAQDLGNTEAARGLRQGRYFGLQKTDLQAVMRATMVNTKRLFTLTDEDAGLAQALREEQAA
jgi:hypothetical protein